MTAIVILAAGASIRLGRAKQMLPFKEGSLLKHTIKVALDAVIGPVIVVTGANEKEISNHIATLPVAIILNEDHSEGIASSIRTGVQYVQEQHPQCEAVVLMVCDQPRITQNLLKALVERKLTTHKPLAACFYNDTIGVPALFDKSFFNELLSLKGEEGGKKILLKHEASVATIPFPFGEIDIDTPDDLNALNWHL